MGFRLDMTNIEWTDKTWNPMVGCSRVAKRNGRSGCDHCYAEGQVNRFQARYDRPTTIRLGASKRPGLTFVPTGPDGAALGKGARWTGAVWLLPDVLDVPLRRRKPTAYFVNSQSDVFHESVVDCEDGRRFIAAMFGVMAACPQHTFQILTKRPHKMREWFELMATQAASCFDGWIPDGPHQFARAVARTMLGSQEHRQRLFTDSKSWPLPNVWIGASVEDQESADERIPELLRVPAAVRFLSCEPLLGPVVIPEAFFRGPKSGLDSLAHRRWVIAGGESGHGARPMHPDWARGLRDQAVAAGVPFFFKQWGEYAERPNAQHGEDGRMVVTHSGVEALMCKVGKGKAGREIDGRTWDEAPEK